MAKLNPYLNFSGNTEEAFNFYRSVFGGEFDAVMRWKENPECDQFSESDKEKIMHISLPIGDEVLMGTDSVESMNQSLTVGNNFSISVTPDSREEADRIFNALSEGGTIICPIQDMFWGDYFGLSQDKFGIQWMINLSNNGNKP